MDWVSANRNNRKLTSKRVLTHPEQIIYPQARVLISEKNLFSKKINTIVFHRKYPRFSGQSAKFLKISKMKLVSYWWTLCKDLLAETFKICRIHNFLSQILTFPSSRPSKPDRLKKPHAKKTSYSPFRLVNQHKARPMSLWLKDAWVKWCKNGARTKSRQLSARLLSGNILESPIFI